MNSSRATIATKHMFRPRRRIWVSVSGKVITGDATVPTQEQKAAPASKQVDWTAYVIDSTTHDVIDGYPRLEGRNELNVDEGEAHKEVTGIYTDKLRFADTKVNAQELKDKVSAGIWELHIELGKPPTVN
jgi:hypothetical protein